MTERLRTAWALAALLAVAGCQPAESVAGQYDVFPAERALDLASGGTWTLDAERPERGWPLSARDVRRVEEALSALADSLPAAPEAYRRQYAGVVVGGREMIFVSAALPELVSPLADGEVIAMTDAGDGAWGALFDPASGRFEHVQRNGSPWGRPEGASLAEYGRRLFLQRNCQSCHTVAPGERLEHPDGAGPTMWGWVQTPRRIAPALPDSAFFRTSLLDPSSSLAPGYTDEMPSYAGQLGPEQVTALWTYVTCLTEDPAPECALRGNERR